VRKARGLTLLEVMVATAVLAIGVLATVALQGRSLAASRRAVAVNEVTRMLTAELELQRHTANLGLIPTGDEAADMATFDCMSAKGAGIAACVVTIERCTIADRDVTCGRSVASGPAYRIGVSVEGRYGESANVVTIATSDRFIAGAAGQP
jgi:prepilin-type N-terminal cleavage/methylation domain-containing protein